MNNAGEGRVTRTPPLAIPIDNRILYFGRDQAVGFLSHFHPAPILLDGEVWPTVELER